MSNLINLKKLTANSLIGLLLAGGLVIESGTRKAVARACDNNGHGNNGDIIITLSSGTEVLLTKFDPSNPGKGDKIEREIKDSNPNISESDLQEAIATILEGEDQYDYERKPTNGVDSDCDGIDDDVEAGSDLNNPLDTDGDGTPDYLDTDSDDDGISDSVEGISDPDGDGIASYRDTDSDGDSISDSIEGKSDADGDGIPNYLDHSNGIDIFGLEIHYLDSAFQCGSDPRQADIKVEVYDKNNNLLTTLSKGDRYVSADFDSIEDLEFDYRIYNFTHCGFRNGIQQAVGGSELLGANDTVPDVGGYSGQASIREMLSDLDSYEELYLVELGTNRTSTPAYDLQDVVLVVNNNPVNLLIGEAIDVSIENSRVQEQQLSESAFEVNFDEVILGTTESLTITNDSVNYTYQGDFNVITADQEGEASGTQYITNNGSGYEITVNQDQTFFGFSWLPNNADGKLIFKHDGVEVATFSTSQLSMYSSNLFVNIFFNNGRVYNQVIFESSDPQGENQFISYNHTFSATQQNFYGLRISNELPIANDNNDDVKTEITKAVVIDALNNDTDPDLDLNNDTLTTEEIWISAINGVSVEGASEISVAGGTVTINNEGKIVYFAGNTPGTYSLQYTLSDKYGATDTATVEIEVTPFTD